MVKDENKKLLSVRLDAALFDWLERFRRAQHFPPARTDVIEDALQVYRRLSADEVVKYRARKVKP